MGEFPESSRSVIELALETCSYDESKARQLLATFNSTKTTTTAATTTGSAASVDSHVSITVTAATTSSVSAGGTSSVTTSVASPSAVTVRVPYRPGSVTAAASTVHAGNPSVSQSVSQSVETHL